MTPAPTLRALLATMQDNTPNPRDFYVVGSGVDHTAYYAALDQHQAEMAQLRAEIDAAVRDARAVLEDR